MGEWVLDVAVEQVGSVTVVSLSGPIGTSTLEKFKQEVDPLLRKAAPHILLDCAGLTYINSKGLALLTNYHRRCYADRGRLGLCNVNDRLAKTIELLKLGTILKFYASRDEALAAMK